MSQVAKITEDIKEFLEKEYFDYSFEFLYDKNESLVANEEDAQELLDPADYSLIDWEPFEMGSPAPRKRTRK